MCGLNAGASLSQPADIGREVWHVKRAVPGSLYGIVSAQ